MSAVYGVNYTKYNSGTSVNIVDRGQYTGVVEFILDTYEADALAAGSTIAMGKPLNAGDVIVGGDLYWDALGTSSTLSVGDANTAALYLGATDTSSAGHADFTKVDGNKYVIGTNSGDTTILLSNAAGATSTGTIKLVLQVGKVG